MSPFERHIRACNNQTLPGGLAPFRIDGAGIGWVGPAVAAVLAARHGEVHRDGEGWALAGTAASLATRSERLGVLAAALAAQGLCRLRGEAFDVRATPGGPVLATLDRGALPAFGIAAAGVHLNGRVRRADGLHLWVGFRARDKSVAPGKLDNLVAGGIPAGLDAAATLVKEAAEEASLPAELLAEARQVGRVSYVMATAEGVRRDRLEAYDLDLPESFVPHPNDGEVERFELWPIARVLAAVRDTDDVKFNVNLVLIDLFLREGLIDPAGAEGRALRAGLEQGA